MRLPWGLGAEARARKLESFHPSEAGVTGPWIAGARSYAGVDVGPSNALSFGPFLSGVMIRANLISSLPLKLFRSDGNGNKREATDHPKYELFGGKGASPNEEQGVETWLHQGELHHLLYGNFYSQIRRNGRSAEIGPLLPDRMEMRRINGRIVYIYDNQIEDPLFASEVLHTFYLSYNGLKGLSLVDLDREGIGLGMAGQRSGAAMFGNNMQFGGVFVRPAEMKPMTPEAETRFLQAVEARHRDPSRAGRWFVAQEGMEPKTLQLDADKAQYIQSRKFSVQDMARLLNLPPYMLGEDTAGQSHASVEVKNKDLLVTLLNPCLRRWESELNRKVLTEADRGAGLYYEFVREGLLQATAKERWETHRVAIQITTKTPNEVRVQENMNRSDAPGADSLWAPINFAPIDGAVNLTLPERALLIAAEKGTLGQMEARAWRDLIASRTPERLPAPARRSLQSRFRLREVFRKLIGDVAQRIVTAEVRAIRKQIERLPETGEDAFRAWLERFFTQHEEFARTVALPVLSAYLEAASAEALDEVGADEKDFRADLDVFVSTYAATFAKRHASGGRGQLEALMRETPRDDWLTVLGRRLDEWQEKSAGKIGENEATQALAGVALAAYTFAGVRKAVVRWPGGTCKFCPRLDGRIIEIGQYVVTDGEQIESVDGDLPPLVVKRSRKHPPWHGHCNCTVEAVIE